MVVLAALDDADRIAVPRRDRRLLLSDPAALAARARDARVSRVATGVLADGAARRADGSAQGRQARRRAVRGADRAAGVRSGDAARALARRGAGRGGAGDDERGIGVPDVRV